MLSKLAISGPVPSAFGAHADAHVEPLVAVDQVVAAAAFDDVAAVAAEDDVARHEAVGGRHRRREPASSSSASRPSIRARLVSAPPVAPPWLRIVAASTLSPRRMSVNAEPDRPSTSAKRSRIELGDAANGSAMWSAISPMPPKIGERQVGGDAEPVVLVGDPVEAGHAVHLVLGVAADEDVVAAFADHLVEAAAADEDVVAGDVIGQERIEIVAGGAVLGAHLDPVVAFVARLRQVDLGAEDEVVALAAEDGRRCPRW